MYTRKQVHIMSLPPTDLNLFFKVKRVHFQKLLRKAANQLGPLDVSTSHYGWEIKDGVTCPVIDKANCICHRVKLNCTNYWLCSAGDVWCNSFIKKVDETGDEE